ncbi:MAG: Histidinol-phosphatase [Alphaproteobacteria bacterium]|nr:MAG: Histidinol-phosphatase [Alphaproteobacteria bacterium]
MTDTPTPKELLSFAHQLADAAARVSLPLFRNVPKIDNKITRGFDPVTEADRNAEAAIRGLIETHYPTHGICGEEFGVKKGEKWQWVLDPIDGTRAFISGIPTWGTLIALNDGKTVSLGIMDQPFTGERYFATAGNGAFLRHDGRDTKLTCRACDALDKAILATTSPTQFVGTAQEAVWDNLSSTVQLTRYGGDCYNYALLAGGHIDLVVEQVLQPYDIQALIPIVEEAGGIITDWQGGNVMQGGQVIAAGDKAAHQAAMDILNG